MTITDCWRCGQPAAPSVMHLFESEVPGDTRVRDALAATRAWAGGTMPMMQARAAGGHAMGAARPLRGLHGSPPIRQGRRHASDTLPNTISARLPTPSRPPAVRVPRTPLRETRNVVGRERSCPIRSAASCLPISADAIPSAGSSSTLTESGERRRTVVAAQARRRARTSSTAPSSGALLVRIALRPCSSGLSSRAESLSSAR